ncbi:glutathione S-transferase family protein [Caldimonas brevitalea]|uniref:glutathione transferase n=1 Tax=Caldimonas brevitalea TaxID=413882 RepID=A0A0G3BDG0_9BURK|nr:glutathione S-transferase family protein [Caldimonas brevitalea]AKJ27424.1 glutathione S-transferase [Caldimonas brevitalea]
MSHPKPDAANTDQRLILVSHALCPYVQRAAIALAEKGIPFERVTIDLERRPEWFQALSPLGKVPLLRVLRPGREEAVLFESAAICEYIEETGGGAALHPADPLERARHRAWMEFGSAVLRDVWHLETATSAGAHDAACHTMAAKFSTLEAALGEGPYFDGEAFRLVDAVFAPIFRYFDVFDALTDTGVFAERPKVQRWRRALAQRPSVQGAVAPDYAQRLHAFLVQHDAYLLRLSGEGRA